MRLESVNPSTEEVLGAFETHTPGQVESILSRSAEAFRAWRDTGLSERSILMKEAAARLRAGKEGLASIITAEMGKPVTEAEAEVEKCAWNCDFYADHAVEFLRDEPRASGASESFLQYAPLGTVLAIMPWNFPFWQVFRFAAPALMAGNTALLKHASNVSRCALAIEGIFTSAGFPPGAFQTVLLPASEAGSLIGDHRIAAVTLTGSEAAGSDIAGRAGRALKKTVLELGGSDPFIVLADADLDAAVKTAVRARFQNAGQSCIAAKRFIVMETVYEEFLERFREEVRILKVGDPTQRATQLGPLARRDLIEPLELQVSETVRQGAKLITGGGRRPGRGYYFEPTILSGVGPRMPAGCEEVFGPVAAIFRARDENDAVKIANDSPFGLGAALWTANPELARQLARNIDAGQVFVNGMVLSDPRLPFGGIKRSGYGRELSELGMREFVNIKTVWIGPAKTI